MGQKAKTFVVTLRADVRDAATIYALLKEHGLDPRNPSALATMAIGLLADMAEQKGFQHFTSTAEAILYLQEYAIIDSDLRKHKNYKTIVDQLCLEDGTTQEVLTSRETKKLPLAADAPNLSAEVARRVAEFKASKDALKNFPKGLIHDDE